LGLPDSQGIGSISKIEPELKGIPIVVMTGLEDEEVGIEAIQQGAQDYLVKGFANPYVLCRVINYAIERKKTELELREAVSAKMQFTSTVSHELRTPLTAIKEGVRLVFSETCGKLNDEQKELLGIAHRNVDRLARLINDVLDYQKLEAGKLDFGFNQNDINEVVAEVAETMELVAKEKNLDIVTSLDDSVFPFEFDRDRIIQVMTNIVNNAVNFTEQGSITITTTRKNDLVQICVQDTGPGIKEEDLPKLFHEFVQLKTNGARKTGGTGLGLAISREIIEKHNGKIWVESKLNKGTDICFVLPTSLRS
jgi:signal transduction histidine kinase